MKALLFSTLLFFTTSSLAQTAADSLAWRSPASLVERLLQCVSSEPGQAKQWDSFKALCAADARIAVLFQRPGKPPVLRSFSVDAFVQTMSTSSGPFQEKQLKVEVDVFNDMATVWQPYELLAGNERRTGVNTYQLYSDGQRWYVHSLLWTEGDLP